MKLEKLISQYENNILQIKIRLYSLNAIEKQLKLISKGKIYRIKNDILYRCIFDIWDMLVIDLASISKGMLGKKGFFNQIKANLGDIKFFKEENIEVPTPSIQSINFSISEEIREHILIETRREHIKTVRKEQKEELFWLFPELKNRQPQKINHKDIDDLGKRFDNLTEHIISNRNEHAHRFENSEDKKVLQRLDFSLLNEKFELIERILNGLRGILNHSSFGYVDISLANTEEVAKDFAFSIIFGTTKIVDELSGINKKINSPNSEKYICGWRIRDQFIEQIHKKHDQFIKEIKINPKDSKNKKLEDYCFNDIRLEEDQK